MNLSKAPIHLALLLLLVSVHIDSSEAVWSILKGFTSLVKSRIYDDVIAFTMWPSSSDYRCFVRLYDRTLKQISSQSISLLSTATGSTPQLELTMCRDLELLFEPQSQQLYLITMENGQVRFRRRSSQLVFTEISNPLNTFYIGGSPWRFNLLVDAYHKLLYVTDSSSLTRIDLINMERPVVLSSTNLISSGGGGPRMMAIVQSTMFVSIGTQGLMLDISRQSLGSFTALSSLAGNTFNLRSVFPVGQTAVFTTENSNGNGMGSNDNLLFVINGADGRLLQRINMNTLSSLADKGSHIIGGRAINNLLAVSPRFPWSTVAFFGSDSRGNLTFLGRSPVVPDFDIQDMEWSGSDFVASGLTGHATNELRDMAANIQDWQTYSLGETPNFNMFLNPLVMYTSTTRMDIYETTLSARFVVRVWDRVTNYTFIPLTVNVRHTLTYPWSLYLRSSSQDPGTLVSSSMILTAGTLSSRYFDLQASIPPTKGSSFNIDISASDGRAGYVQQRIWLNVLDPSNPNPPFNPPMPPPGQAVQVMTTTTIAVASTRPAEAPVTIVSTQPTRVAIPSPTPLNPNLKDSPSAFNTQTVLYAAVGSVAGITALLLIIGGIVYFRRRSSSPPNEPNEPNGPNGLQGPPNQFGVFNSQFKTMSTSTDQLTGIPPVPPRLYSGTSQNDLRMTPVSSYNRSQNGTIYDQPVGFTGRRAVVNETTSYDQVTRAQAPVYGFPSNGRPNQGYNQSFGIPSSTQQSFSSQSGGNVQVQGYLSNKNSRGEGYRY